MKLKRGDIVLVELEGERSEGKGEIRPCLVIQNEISNEESPSTIIALITSKVYSKSFPTNVLLRKEDSLLTKDTTILLSHIKTIDKKRIKKKVSSLDNDLMRKVEIAIQVSLGIAV